MKKNIVKGREVIDWIMRLINKKSLEGKDPYTIAVAVKYATILVAEELGISESELMNKIRRNDDIIIKNERIQ